jgi:regulator of sirC expression with transglutaminase-like and TPR domain
LLQSFESLILAGADLPLDEAFLTISAVMKGSRTSGPADTRAVDVIDHLVMLDELASDIASPTIEGIARHLFSGDEPFRGNHLDYYDPANSLLDEVIDRRTGIPITLSVVMIEVARRLGVRLSGVGMPGHFLVGTDAPIGKVPDRFVDPFHGGVILDLDGCRQLFRRVTGSSTTFDPRFLSTLHPVAVVERALNNLKGIYSASDSTPELRSVMALRARLPGFAKAEREEYFRLMAPFN